MLARWLCAYHLAGPLFAIAAAMVGVTQALAQVPLPTYDACNPSAPPFVPVPRPPDAETAQWLPADPAARYGFTTARPAGDGEWRILALGDIMTSREVLWTAQTHQASGLSPKDAYARPFRGIADLLAGSDLTIANLEFPVRPDRPPEGCKPFNGEPAYLDALKEVGFDLLFTANNHILDQGVDGATTTLEEIRRRGISTMGAVAPRQPWQELLEIDVGTKQKLKVGFLNYTSGVADAGYRRNLEHLLFGANVNYAFFNNDERLAKRAFGWFAGMFFPTSLIPSQDKFIEHVRGLAAAARDRGVEYVVAFMSWGKALAFYPTSDQRHLAQRMCDAGIDAILGAGPHTVQPVEMLARQGGGECLVAYSLGNLIGGVQGLANYGLALEIALTRDERGVGIRNVVPHTVFAAAREQADPKRPVSIELEPRELAEFTRHLSADPDAAAATGAGGPSTAGVPSQ